MRSRRSGLSSTTRTSAQGSTDLALQGAFLEVFTAVCMVPSALRRSTPLRTDALSRPPDVSGRCRSRAAQLRHGGGDLAGSATLNASIPTPAWISMRRANSGILPGVRGGRQGRFARLAHELDVPRLGMHC